MIHYMGSELWAVGFLKREVGDKGGELTTHYEWVENLTFQQAMGLIATEKAGFTRTTPKALRNALGST